MKASVYDKLIKYLIRIEILLIVYYKNISNCLSNRLWKISSLYSEILNCKKIAFISNYFLVSTLKIIKYVKISFYLYNKNLMSKKI